MPIFEFECDNGHVTEKILPDSDTHAIPCPICQLPATRKISSVNFTFGWIRTWGKGLNDKLVRDI
jgi:putative FmdB family regulatory protein